tara:strand:+ start:1663 stop:2001 length:339 start_codon:yes stop_codon:yes gene_type:complete
MNVFGILIRINQKEPGESPPFSLEHPDLYVVKMDEGWGVLWTMAAGAMEFATSTSWAQGAASQITNNFINKHGFQGGESLVVCFPLDPDDDEPLDMNMLVERYDWTSGVVLP